MLDTKLKQQDISKSKAERDLAMAEAQRVKEIAFKLVVKIISWENGSSSSNVVQSVNKITPEEWAEYKRQRMSIATADNRDKAKEKLEQTFQSIKEHGGFA